MSFSLIVRNSGWLIAGKCLTLGAAFLSVAVVARVYGPSAFGALSLSLSIAALLVPVIQLGLNSIVTRDLVNEPERQGEILGTVMLMRSAGTIFSMLVVAVLIAMGVFTDVTIGNYVQVLLLGELIKVGLAFSFWFESKTQGRVVALCELSATLVACALRVVLSLLGVDFKYIVYSHALEGALIGVAYIVAFRLWAQPRQKLTVSASLAFYYLKRCAPLIASSATAVVYQKIDQVMLAYYMDHAAVGVYAVASRISEIWYFVPTMIAVSAFPTILSARIKSEAEYRDYLQRIFDYLALLGFAAALAITFVGPSFIQLFFGSEYAMAATILMVHVWGGVFISMRALASKWILAEDVLRYSLISQGAGAVVNVVLNMIMIPMYGLLGAAVATMIAYAVAGYLIFAISPATRIIFIMMSKSLILRGLWVHLRFRALKN